MNQDGMIRKAVEKRSMKDKHSVKLVPEHIV